MTPAEINQAIAESMGWVRVPPSEVDADMAAAGGSVWYRQPVEKTVCTAHDLPNYHDDLNAIQGAVALMPNYAHNAFRWEVVKYLMHIHEDKPLDPIDYMLAPADVWARAYVKAIGKWREQ
jgi:hypothetical protein